MQGARGRAIWPAPSSLAVEGERARAADPPGVGAVVPERVGPHLRDGRAPLALQFPALGVRSASDPAREHERDDQGDHGAADHGDTTGDDGNRQG